jgi:hypothetical protein
MPRKLKRNNVLPAGGEQSSSAKRQRTATQIFEQGINPAPPTPPPTVRRPTLLQEPALPLNRGTPSPLFVAEDEDEDEAGDEGEEEAGDEGEEEMGDAGIITTMAVMKL